MIIENETWIDASKELPDENSWHHTAGMWNNIFLRDARKRSGKEIKEIASRPSTEVTFYWLKQN